MFAFLLAVAAVDWVGVTAILAPQVVALAVVVVNAVWQSKLSEKSRSHERDLAQDAREHERLMANEARMQSRREGIYVDLLKFLRRYGEIVDRIDPTSSAGRRPPEQPSLEEIWELDARVAAFGSSQVNDCLHGWDDNRAAFWDESETLLEMRAEKKAGGQPDGIRQIYGRSISEQQERIKEVKRNLQEMQREVRKQVARELRGGPAIPPKERNAPEIPPPPPSRPR